MNWLTALSNQAQNNDTMASGSNDEAVISTSFNHTMLNI